MAPGSIAVAELEMDPRPGGTFRLVMRRERDEITHTGEYREVDPPRRLVFTWKSPATHGRETVVTVEFHSADGHREGWTSIAERLALYLASGRSAA